MIGAAGVYRCMVDLADRGEYMSVETVRVMAGLASKSTVWDHLVRLRDRGLVQWDEGHDGTLRLVARPQTFARLLSIEAT